MKGPRPQIAVSGGGRCSPEEARAAHRLGRLLGRAGAVVLTGGRGGVMAAAAEGARAEGGATVGILPGADPASSPPDHGLEVCLFTGMGQARNLVLVLSADVVVAVGGEWGTLSEVALALKHRIPVVSLRSWEPVPPSGARDPLLSTAVDPEEAVARALELCGR